MKRLHLLQTPANPNTLPPNPTLAQWNALYGHILKLYPGGSIAVPVGPNDKGYPELFHLTDYVFMSFVAGTSWLTPRTPPTPEKP